MKKAFAFVLIFLLLASFACSEVTTCTYVSDTGLFTFEFPEGFTSINSTVIRLLMQTDGGLEYLKQLGFSDEMLDSFNNSNTECLLVPNSNGRVNITTSTSDVSMDELLAYSDFIIPELYKQFEAFGIDKTNIEIFDAKQYGNNIFWGYEVDFYGITTITQYTIIDDDLNEYQFNFESVSHDVIDLILSTFELTKDNCINTSLSSFTFLSQTGKYQIDLPNGYNPINTETINEIKNTDEYQKALNALGITQIKKIINSNSEYIFNYNYSGYFLVGIQKGQTMAELEENSNILPDLYKAEYAKLGVTGDNLQIYGMVQYGQNRYFAIRTNLYGVVSEQYLTCDKIGNEYYLQFTNISDDEKAFILSSFSIK